MKKGISKPVLAFVLAGLALTLWVTWHVLTRPGSAKAPQGETAPAAVQTEAAAPEPTPEVVPVAVAAPEPASTNLIPIPLGTVLVEPENAIWRSDRDCLA